jgi:hypothetical protein
MASATSAAKAISRSNPARNIPVVIIESQFGIDVDASGNVVSHNPSAATGSER